MILGEMRHHTEILRKPRASGDDPGGHDRLIPVTA